MNPLLMAMNPHLITTPIGVVLRVVQESGQEPGQLADMMTRTTPASVNPVSWVLLLVVMALMPFVLTMVTSFAKLIIVGGIVRQAIGTPQIPPTSVLTGLALILSVHIMSPVIVEAWTEFQDASSRQVPTDPSEDRSVARAQLAAQSTEGPMRRFLEHHAAPQNVELFRNLRTRLYLASERRAPGGVDRPGRVELGSDTADRVFELTTVYAPAFILTELTEAFQIGFLIFVPFLVIDLVVSNLLLAMGMHMLSPVTVSLPLKLLLFVLIDGWTLILQGIVLGYTS